MDDLFQALKMLQSGVQQFAVGRVINSANDRVQELRQADIDERTRIQGLRQTANELTMRLAGMGADATTISAAAGAVEPPKGPLIQSPFQGMLADLDTAVPEDREEAVRRSKEYEQNKSDSAKELAAAKYAMAQPSKDADKLKKIIDGFADSKYGKELKKRYDDLLLSPDEITNNLEKQTAIRGFIKQAEGGGSRVSDADVKAAIPTTGIAAEIARAYNELLLGKPYPKDAEVLQGVLELGRKRTANLIKKRISGYASGQGEISGFDPNKVSDLVYRAHFGETENSFGGGAAAAQPPPAVGTAPTRTIPGLIPYGK